MKKRFMKNKKADVPITILAIMVVAICALAILSFFNSRSKVESDYLGVELIEEINADVEKFYFYLNAGFSEEEAAEKIGAEIMGGKLILERAKTIKGEDKIFIEYNMNWVRED